MARLRTLKPLLRTQAPLLTPPPKVKAQHYYTPEHIAWSKAVIARSGRICQGCGRTDTRLYADHIVELQDGGKPFDLANGQALCGSCHTRKTAGVRAARMAAQC
jgi:5-methylcytosine-specific restriction protein A